MSPDTAVMAHRHPNRCTASETMRARSMRREGARKYISNRKRSCRRTDHRTRQDARRTPGFVPYSSPDAALSNQNSEFPLVKTLPSTSL
jgi:hypothetical protein